MQWRGAHLTYCTNIHPANGLNEVRASLEAYAVPLKERLSPDAPFGVGLRLSGSESLELLTGERLREFRSFLDERGLYVFTINGFPYGPFHGQAVKAQVHAPDWREEERVAYTLRLAHILAALLPAGQEGSISTSPLSYAAWIDRQDRPTWAHLARQVIRVVEALYRLRQESGVFIHLDMEPEPDGLLQNSVELAGFFRDWLLGLGAEELARHLGCPMQEAKDAIRDHFQVCFDTCHVAVMYEEPGQALENYRQVGLRVGKIQLSSALRLPLPDDQTERAALAQQLAPFAEGTYLHQVVAQERGGQLRQYADLPAALPEMTDPQVTEWRVHFHIPVFLSRAGGFQSTQDALTRTLELLSGDLTGRHLEVETYTWDVLPGELKRPLVDSIERELRWVQYVL